MSCFITVPLPYTLLGLLNPEDESTRIFHNVTNSLDNDTVREALSLQQHSCDKLRPQEICLLTYLFTYVFTYLLTYLLNSWSRVLLVK